MAKEPEAPKSFLDKMFRRQSQPPPAPEASHFARIDAEREAEQRAAEDRKAKQRTETRRTTDPQKAQPTRAHPVVEAMEPRPTKSGRDFDKAAQTSKRLTQQVFDTRFRSEPARAAALDALEEAQKRREQNDQAFAAALAKQREMIRDLNGRPWSAEYGKAINDVVSLAWEAHEHEKLVIAHDLTMSLAEAAMLNPPGRGFTKPLPPRQLTGPEPDSLEPFNRASAARPDWTAIFYMAVDRNISIEAARTELEPAPEPSPGRDETPPVAGWSSQFNDVSRGKPKPGQEINFDL